MKTRTRGIVLVSIVAAVCVALIVYFFVLQGIIASVMASRPRPAIPVSAIAAEASTWTPGIDAIGTAKAGLGADISVEASGVVKAVAFVPNQKANAGQLLVQIDDTIEQADIISAEANIKLAQSEVDRISALVKRGASPQATLDNAIAQRETARATYARLKAVLEQKAISAPFAGVLGVPRVVVGQYVSVGTVVVTLQDIDRILVDFTVPEQSAGLLVKGQKVRLGVTTDDLAFSGTLTGFDPKVDPQTRLINAQALVDAPVGRILPGQFLRVRVALPEVPNVVTVPETAVVPSLYGDYVFTVATAPPAEGAAEGTPPVQTVKQTFVKIGRRDGTKIEITEGLAAGDVIVISGQNRLQSGAAVTIADDVVPSKPATNGAKP
jgi:membrane fusion protein (multidrug efflux system)